MRSAPSQRSRLPPALRTPTAHVARQVVAAARAVAGSGRLITAPEQSGRDRRDGEREPKGDDKGAPSLNVPITPPPVNRRADDDWPRGGPQPRWHNRGPNDGDPGYRRYEIRVSAEFNCPRHDHQVRSKNSPRRECWAGQAKLDRNPIARHSNKAHRRACTGAEPLPHPPNSSASPHRSHLPPALRAHAADVARQVVQGSTTTKTPRRQEQRPAAGTFPMSIGTSRPHCPRNPFLPRRAPPTAPEPNSSFAFLGALVSWWFSCPIAHTLSPHSEQRPLTLPIRS